MTDLPADPDTSEAGRRRWPWLAVLTVLAALVVFVLVWFQPQKLFIDERVEEPIPTVAPQTVTTAAVTSSPAQTTKVATTGETAATPATTPAPPPAGPVELARGEFVSLDHGTSGAARILELADSQRIVRLERLETDNGPDLYLYLTTNPAAGDEAAFDDDFVDLGRLKGNQGDQNYEVPAGTDLTRFVAVVIWCDRFDSAFGAADLGASAPS